MDWYIYQFYGSCDTYGCFLKWWYPQNTPKMINFFCFLVGKPMVVGYHHFRKPSIRPFGAVWCRHGSRLKMGSRGAKSCPRFLMFEKLKDEGVRCMKFLWVFGCYYAVAVLFFFFFFFLVLLLACLSSFALPCFAFLWVACFALRCLLCLLACLLVGWQLRFSWSEFEWTSVCLDQHSKLPSAGNMGGY